MRGDDSDSDSGRTNESSIQISMDMLCQELNMDEQTASEAMQNFKSIWNTYTLEGDVVHWLACSLYAACRKGSTPTVGKGIMEGNCVSLTRILRTSKLSLIQFFNKMKKWSDMSNLSEDFRNRIGRLERNFEVSTVIFRKFEPIFMDMFQDPQGEPPRQPRSRKHRRLPCHVSDVFKFCWTLFVYTKGNFHMIGDDLVNSYHLLLCCLDLVFGNALLCSNRKDLVNPLFKGLPSIYRSENDTPDELLCVINRLCELHDGLVVEAKGIKEHYFKPYIKRLFERQILKGNEELLTELLDTQNFIDNNKAINREYEEYVLTVGDFDERVFLGADADEEIGTPRKAAPEPRAGQLSARMQVESNLQQHFEKKRSLAPSTPLTGRKYLKEKELLVTPVSSATQSVSRLQSMVSGLRNAPSELTSHILKYESIKQPLLYCSFVVMDFLIPICLDFAENRMKLSEILYYKVLENVMAQETKRLQGKDMVLLEQDIFHCSLMACCLEVVLFAYSSQRTFPWIISVFKLRPFYFFKVIEVFIRSEEGLSRDMVKHLNSIEEQVLECRAWTADSVLWESLQQANNKVPTVEEVNVKCNLDCPFPLDVPPSPLSVHDRYSSPAAGSAKRRLFGDDSGPQTQQSPSLAKRLTFSPGGTLKIDMTTANGQQLSIPLQGSAFMTTPIIVIFTPTYTIRCIVISLPLLSLYKTCKCTYLQSCVLYESPTNRKVCILSSSKLTLNVYHLASVRLRDLCVRLDISAELRGKIWTCFEHSIVQSPELMKDRHLDQLLLCAIYIISKITKDAHSFQDIMKCYRSQPQASSHVYRSVLIKVLTKSLYSSLKCLSYIPIDMAGSELWPQCSEHLPLPPYLSAAEKANRSSIKESPMYQGEERGDLIQFYNSVYVLKMKGFALRYAMEAPPLSPFPLVRAQPLSPRRISQRHSIYVSPHKSGSCLTPNSAYTYRINGSPSKELTDINRMIRQGGVSRKRAFSMEGDYSAESPTKRVCPESEDVLLKRLQDVVSERAHH
uniref:Retinoblastoma-like protein 1 n=1 Tax=Esox lucius TaxID=8010 RepID=A0A6Q2YMI1_ESOLU